MLKCLGVESWDVEGLKCLEFGSRLRWSEEIARACNVERLRCCNVERLWRTKMSYHAVADWLGRQALSGHPWRCLAKQISGSYADCGHRAWNMLSNIIQHIGRSQAFRNGIFHPCALWARGLARSKNCRRIAIAVGAIWKFRPTFRPEHFDWRFLRFAGCGERYLKMETRVLHRISLRTLWA